jgi:hypothetical protein
LDGIAGVESLLYATSDHPDRVNESNMA